MAPLAAAPSPALCCSFALVLMMCRTGSAAHNDPAKKGKKKKNYRDSSIFFSFFSPSAAWLGFTASAPAVVYHGWPTMLQRSASGLSEEEEEKEEEVEKEEEGESGFSSSPPTPSFRALTLKRLAVVSITTNQPGGRQPLQCSPEESCMYVVFFGRVRRGVERDWGCAGKSIFIGNNSHICFAARLCATEC